MRAFDNIIIGAGPGGYELAALLAGQGESVAVVERAELGGTCLNRGCIPTKCLVATAERALSAQSAAAFGCNVEGVSVDFPKAVERMEAVVANLRDGVAAELKGCTLVSGEARLSGGRAVEVDGERLEASKRLVIATGSRPAVLPIEGASLAITSDEALRLKELPQSVVIIGGGVIGMEFASVLAALGAKVTVVEFCKEILPPFDPEVAKRLRMSLSRRGVDIVVGAAVGKIEPSEAGVAVTYAGKRGDSTVEASVAIMAVGRRPVVPAGAEEAGLKLTAKGFIEVDELMRTNLDGVYAVGDVNGLSMLAHSAIAQGKVVAYGDAKAFNPYRVPSIVFTHPEVAQVGMTPAQLDEQGLAYAATKHLYASNGKAQAMGEAEGFVKFLSLKEHQGQVAGVSIIGAHAADLIAEATIVATEGWSLRQLQRRIIHAHPTLSELFD